MTKEDEKKLQVEAAKAKAEVVGSTSLSEQAKKVEDKTPGSWEKPGSDLQEPGKVEGKLPIKKDELGKDLHYVAGKSAPVRYDKEAVAKLQEELHKIIKEYGGSESDVPMTHEYWGKKRQLSTMVNG